MLNLQNPFAQIKKHRHAQHAAEDAVYIGL